jgi:hypothetical protein
LQIHVMMEGYIAPSRNQFLVKQGFN